jgi:hypothetical protein
MSEPGFWVSHPCRVHKGVNTRTDNLRVHTASFDTRTTSVRTTALSHNIVFICRDINALGTHECYFGKIFDYGDQTERSGWLEWRSHGCPKVTGTTSIVKKN